MLPRRDVRIEFVLDSLLIPFDHPALTTPAHDNDVIADKVTTVTTTVKQVAPETRKQSGDDSHGGAGALESRERVDR